MLIGKLIPALIRDKDEPVTEACRYLLSSHALLQSICKLCFEKSSSSSFAFVKLSVIFHTWLHIN